MDPAVLAGMPPTPSCPPRQVPGRRGWVAGLLSFFLCGLGQLYAGSWRRALAFYVGDLIVQVGALLAFVHGRTEPFNLYLPLAVYLFYRVVVIVDAVRLARRAEELGFPWFIRWPIYLVLIVGEPYVVSYQAALVLRDHVAEAFWIPATSMSDTLLPGDRFLVDKLFYSEPARLDVVVYRWTDPEGKQETFVDRVIGMPGERVAILDNNVLVDGRELDEPYVRHDGEAQRNFGPTVVPAGYYFVLGDRRNHSRDSRDPDIGFIAREQIVGRAMTIFDSTEPTSGKLRWGRIGRVIR